MTGENKNKTKVVIPQLLKTYLAIIRNSVGTRMFRNFYAEVDGAEQDIMSNGDVSCAFFVSSVLTIFGLTERIHATVDGVVYDLQKSGWAQLNEPEEGCVIVWGSQIDEQGEAHKHIGFYVGDGRAVSNNSKQGYPATHAWDNRKVEALYWNTKLKG